MLPDRWLPLVTIVLQLRAQLLRLVYFFVHWGWRDQRQLQATLRVLSLKVVNLVLIEELIIGCAVRAWRSIDPLDVLAVFRQDRVVLRRSCFRLRLSLGLLLMRFVKSDGLVLAEEAFRDADGTSRVGGDQVIVRHVHLLVCLGDHLLHNRLLGHLVLGRRDFESVFAGFMHRLRSRLGHWSLVPVHFRF